MIFAPKTRFKIGRLGITSTSLPFKPEAQPANVQVRDPEPVNILTAMAENESVKKESNPAKGNRAFVALPSRWRQSTNPCTRCNYSLLNIPTVTGAGMKSV